MFYFDKTKAKLCNVIKMKEVKLWNGYVFFRYGNVQHAGARWKGNHGLRYHAYLIPEDVDLKDGAAFERGCYVQSDVQIKFKVVLHDVHLVYMPEETRTLAITCLGIRLLCR